MLAGKMTLDTKADRLVQPYRQKTNLPTPPKGRLGRVMWMIPSLEQNPPLLVFCSTVFTTCRREAQRDVKYKTILLQA